MTLPFSFNTEVQRAISHACCLVKDDEGFTFVRCPESQFTGCRCKRMADAITQYVRDNYEVHRLKF